MNRSDFARISRMARTHEPSMALRFRAVLDAQSKALGKAVSEGHDFTLALHYMLPIWRDALAQLHSEWGTRFAVDGYLMARAIMGKRKCFGPWDRRLQSLSKATEATIGNGSEELIARALKSRVGDWVNATSNIETATSARKYQKIYEEALKGQRWTDEVTGEEMFRNSTLREIGTSIMNEGLTDDAVRADLMATTTTFWGYNEGAQQAYKDDGLSEMEWMVTEDDFLCKFCAPLDGTVVSVDAGFFKAGDILEGEADENGDSATMTLKLDVNHPPAHPRCRCVLLPVVDFGS